MKCNKCGNEITENSKFCTNCGVKVDKTNEKNNKNTITIKLSYFIIAIVIIIVIVGLILFFISKQQNNPNLTLNNMQEEMHEGNEYQAEKGETNNTDQNTEVLTENDNNVLSEEGIGIEFDINKFIKELSYKSLSTVNDGIHGGDGYRYDYEFYNSDLSINKFNVTNDGSTKLYTLETNGNESNNYKFILNIELKDDNKLNQIKITSYPPTPQAKGILNCAMEVEEALGYTLWNSRNYQNVTQLEENLKGKDYIEQQGNYAIQTTNIIQQIENEKTEERIVFEYANNEVSYTINFINNANINDIENDPTILQEETDEPSKFEELYNQVKEGMTYTEVCLLLGLPTSTEHHSSGTSKTCIWNFSQTQTIFIVFNEYDRVEIKSRT